MNLLHLPNEIQVDLLNPPALPEIHDLSERNLRTLVSCTDEENQLHQWQTLLGGGEDLSPRMNQNKAISGRLFGAKEASTSRTAWFT
jgi:hypothetical protein